MWRLLHTCALRLRGALSVRHILFPHTHGHTCTLQLDSTQPDRTTVTHWWRPRMSAGNTPPTGASERKGDARGA